MSARKTSRPSFIASKTCSVSPPFATEYCLNSTLMPSISSSILSSTCSPTPPIGVWAPCKPALTASKRSSRLNSISFEIGAWAERPSFTASRTSSRVISTSRDAPTCEVEKSNVSRHSRTAIRISSLVMLASVSIGAGALKSCSPSRTASSTSS